MFKYNLNQKLIFIIFLCLLVIFSTRFFNIFINIDFKHHFTSGYEEESLLIFWYNIKNLNIYTDHLEFPYRWAIYNWLFYYFYSFGFILAEKIFQIGYEFIPYISRIITFLFSVLSFVFLTLSFFQINKNKSFYWILFLCFFSIYGTSTGWWVMTARPDIAALSFEIIAIYFFLKNKHNLHIKNIFILTIIFYLAWAFKQTSLVVLFSVSLYLLMDKKYKTLLIIISLFIFFILFTIKLNNTHYLQSIYMLNTSSLLYDYNYKRILGIIGLFFLKNFFLFSLFFYILFKKKYKYSSFYFDTTNRFLFFGLVGSLLYFFSVLTNKGTSDNHTFILIIFIALFVFNNLSLINDLQKNLSVTLTSFVQIIIFLLVIFGIRGNLAPSEIKGINEYKKCTKNIIKSPAYIFHSYLALPWITEYENPTVINFNYQFEEKSNRLKLGGHKNLINKNFYKTLVVSKYEKINNKNYYLIKSCNSISIYQLKM